MKEVLNTPQDQGVCVCSDQDPALYLSVHWCLCRCREPDCALEVFGLAPKRVENWLKLTLELRRGREAVNARYLHQHNTALSTWIHGHVYRGNSRVSPLQLHV